MEKKSIYEIEEINFAEVGPRIRERRLELGLTQEQLAEYISVSPQTIGNIENEKRGMKLQTAYALTQVLDVSMDWLVKG